MSEKRKSTLASDFKLFKKRMRFNYYCMKTPINNKMIMFESFHGKRYADNVKELYLEMLNDEKYKDFKFMWAFDDTEAHAFLRENERTGVVKKGCKKYYRLYAKSKYWVNNVSLPDFLKPRKRHVYIETWHGTPLKRLGCDIEFESDPRQSLKRMHKRYMSKGKKITYLVSPSPFYSEKIASAFNLKKYGKENIMIETGYPRNDALFTFDDAKVKAIKEKLSVPEGKKVVLYTPTWRDNQYQNGDGFQYSGELDTKKLMDTLGDEYVLLFRAHHQVGLSHIIDGTKNIIDATEVDDVNDLYIISDLMITDYSSTMFDYGNLKRPMIFYMYDLDEYQNEVRGFYFDLKELPGPVIQKQDDLAPAIADLCHNFVYDDNYKNFNQKFNPLDDANAAKRVLDICINTDEIELSFKDKVIFALRRFKHRFHVFTTMTKYNVFGFISNNFGIVRKANSKKLKALKNKYKGDRCFVIGNGPSLKSEDLDTLTNEYTFGTNMVYKIFDQTKWRPSFHCVSDSIYANQLGEELFENVKSPLFTIEKTYMKMEKRPADTTYVHSFNRDPYRVRGNAYAYIMVKATVLCLAMEMAFHMGFKEIYLLGVDCSNPHAANGHFTKNYSSEEVASADLRRIQKRLQTDSISTKEAGDHIIDRSLEVYQTLGNYAKKHGIKVYNATRGGFLELFPRVDFDSIDKKGEKE